MKRRSFIKSTGAAAAVSLSASALTKAAFISPAFAQTQQRIVVIGGGFGGASFARMLRALNKNYEIVIIERHREYVTGPFSNLVISGHKALNTLTHDYSGFAALDIQVVQDTATAVDVETQTVTLGSGDTLSYDRLVMSPGISIKWGAIEGYDVAAAEIMPHAWIAGAQTQLLADKVQAMDDGGTIIIAPPPAPFRCPPGPYERVSLIGDYFLKHKPRSKILVLDGNDGFSKQALFEEVWESFYPGMIERIPFSEAGQVTAVDALAGVVSTDFDDYTPDVANIIPPQQAGEIAVAAGLTDASGFCPINSVTFESRLAANIHILGDAANMGMMPKSGFSANAQAKHCAFVIDALLQGEAPSATKLINVCYSLANEGYGFSVAGVYQLTPDAITAVEGAGGTSPVQAEADVREMEADYARAWYKTITEQMFG